MNLKEYFEEQKRKRLKEDRDIERAGWAVAIAGFGVIATFAFILVYGLYSYLFT